MTDTVSVLMKLGFTKTEASAYQALVKHGKTNGYQLAKSLGICASRPLRTVRLHEKELLFRR